MANNPLRSHPSAMTAEQYYDSESEAIKQTKDVLGLESVPFFKRPLDADTTDRQVGGFKEGENPVFETVLGNRYTVARDPDQRTTRTKIEEDVIPAVKAYAENPRLPTGEEVVGAGKAIVEGVVETASIPGDLLTGKRSPTDVQMGDVFDIAGGAAVGASTQTLPDNAVGSMVGAFRRKEKPYVEKSIGINPDLDKTLSLKDAFGEEGVENFYSIKKPARSGRFAIANKIFDGVNIRDFIENVYSKLDTKKLSEPRVYSKFLSSSGEDIIKEYSDRLVLNASEDIEAKGVSVPDRVSEALSDNFTTLVDNLRHQQFNLDKKARFNVGTYDVYPVKDNIFVPTETELAFPSPRLEQKTDTSFSYPTQTINFSGPISSYVETMNIPKKGITANNFLKEIRNNLNVPVRVFPDSFVDSSKRYTREELLDLVEQKEFKVKAQEQEMYQGTQRQNEAGFTYGDEQEYFFMNIAATTGAGKITPRRQHSSSDDIGHVRGSIITPNVNSPYSSSGAITDFNAVTENKPFLLAEEFQSDLYQKGYKKTNPKFMQEAVERYYGGLSKKAQKVVEDSSLAANKINLPAVNDYGYIRNNTMIITDEAIERTMKDATDRGYIGGDTFDSISFSVDRLKGVETDEVFKPAYLDPLRIENTVRMLAEKGVSINLPETEVFRAEMFVPPSVDVETIFKVDPLSLSNSSLIVDQSTFLDSNPQVLFRVQSMDSNTAEIFNTTTIGELNAATQEWLESEAKDDFVPSLIEDIVRNETNAERMGRGDRITAEDIGGRSGGTIGEPGSISEVAENLVRKKLGLDFTETSAEDVYSSRYVNYPDNTEGYFRLINAYSDLIYEQVSFPEDTVNVLGKLSATKKTNDEQIKKLEDYITKTTQGILDYRTKIVDQENEMDNHFEKFVGKLDGTEVTPEQAKGLLRAAYTDLKRNTNDFQGLDAVTPPIKQVKSVTDEMLKILIVKAATSGVDKIVIPPTDRIAAIRFRDHRASPEKFTQLYDEGIPASIQELKQNYPEVIVTRDVEMPYDNSMYPPGYNDIPSNQGTVIDLEAFFKKYDVSPDGSVRQFAQGGVAMKDQMEMSFGRAETRDPVSGNDVPPGSLPKEVRDDIPARLSEGEYVVPADVVRYYGVKFFEDLRTQAKMGLQQMDADGRIGGEPIEPQQGLTEADLAGLEQMLVTGVAEGGLMDKIAYTAQNDPLVNQRINGMGMEVGFASGGMAQSLFSDPTKIDQIISQVTALAQQKPEIMQELAKRGISITRTNAQVQPQQMQKQNSPAQTTNPVVNAAEGVLATGEFNPNRFRTVGGTYFEPETYSPDFGVKPPTPVSVPTDAAAPVEPAGGCGRGMMWNGLMCVVDPNYRYEESEGPDPEPEKEEEGLKKSWYEGDEDFYTDPKSYIEKQLARGEYKKESLLATILVPGAGLAMGVANKIDDLNGIAKARATFEINQAFKTEGFEKGNPWADNMQKTLDSLGYNLVASGNMYKDSFAKDIDFDDWEDATGSDIGEAARRKDAYAKSRAIERERLQREQESTYVPSPEEQVFVQTILKEQKDRDEGPGNIGRGDGSRPSGVSSSAKGVSSMPSPSASPSVTKPGSSPTSSTRNSSNKNTTSSSGSYGGKKDDTDYGGYTGSPGGRATGGLVQRRKKKK